MLCPKCNSEMDSNGICPKCKSVSDDKEKKNTIVSRYYSCKENMEINLREGKRANIHTKTIIDMAIILIMSIILTIVFAATFTSYVDRAMVAIEEGNVDKAKNYYNNRIKDNTSEKAILFEQIEAYMDDIVESYNVDNIENTKAKEIIGSVSSAISDFDITPYSTKVEVLKSSKAAFEDGYTYSAKGEYQVAINKFSMVVDYDYNYDTAQNRIEYEKTKYKNEVLDDINSALSNGSDYYVAAIEKAKKLMDSGLFENDIEVTEAYTNMIDTYVDYVEETINSAKDTHDYDVMYKLAGDALIQLGENDILTSSLAEAGDLIVFDALDRADACLNSGDYSQAAQIVVDALEYCEDDKTLTGKLVAIIDELAKK